MLKLGAVAQLGERLVCNQEATGSIPVSSTRKNGTGLSIIWGGQEGAWIGFWIRFSVWARF
jgi:hypothetical protein